MLKGPLTLGDPFFCFPVIFVFFDTAAAYSTRKTKTILPFLENRIFKYFIEHFLYVNKLLLTLVFKGYQNESSLALIARKCKIVHFEEKGELQLDENGSIASVFRKWVMKSLVN